jgi:hypothetical protein
LRQPNGRVVPRAAGDDLDELPIKIPMPQNKHSDRLDYADVKFHRSAPIDHADLDRARKAAEALFGPKRPIEDYTTPNATGSSQQNARKPRILGAVRGQLSVIQAAHQEPTMPPLQRKTQAPQKRVPVSHLTRLRMWLKYGMTIRQAADMYRVSVSEIERIVQKA